jgi:hypothetical protein
MMTTAITRVSELSYSPFRDLERNPMNEERVAALMDSIERNDLWRGIVARPVDDGYQIAFGHHRLEAVRRLVEQGALEDRLEIDVADLSDAQMLQYLSDENLNQGGKSPAAALEVVVAARFMLDGFLRESDTPEEFFEKANITAARASSGEYSPQRWGQMKSVGVVGRDILRLFLCGEKHSKGWDNNALSAGINYVDAHYRAEEAKKAKEQARQEYEELTNEPVPDDEKMEELTQRQEQADADLKEAEELKGYRDILEMFPRQRNGTNYVRELERRRKDGNPLSRNDQVRFANHLIREKTGERDIARRLGELIAGQAAWAKEEARRKKARAKATADKRKRWKEQWTRNHSMTPDQFIRENLGLFNQMNDFLDQIAQVIDYVQDDDLMQSFVTNCATTRDKLNAFSVGLSADQIKKVN